jgi:hypothetical protein
MIEDRRTRIQEELMSTVRWMPAALVLTVAVTVPLYAQVSLHLLPPTCDDNGFILRNVFGFSVAPGYRVYGTTGNSRVKWAKDPAANPPLLDVCDNPALVPLKSPPSKWIAGAPTTSGSSGRRQARQ